MSPWTTRASQRRSPRGSRESVVGNRGGGKRCVVPAQAATPGLNAFEQGVKYGNHKAAQAVGNEAAPTPVISGGAAASSGAAAAASSGAAPVAR